MYSSEWNLQQEVVRSGRGGGQRLLPGHVRPVGDIRPVDLHLLVKPVVQDERVGYGQSVRLHRMQLAVVEVADVRVVEVRHLGPGMAAGAHVGSGQPAAPTL